jgi:parallel beta-helix repeat protein
MKLILLLPALWLAICANATNYYFSSSIGDDNRSSAQAQNPNTPWRTIGKLNSFSSGLRAGDNIYFSGGETYYGTINIGKSGTAGAPITFSTYGSSAKAVITGLTTISNWAYIGNGIWESYNPNLGSVVNTVLINDQPHEMGRYPNSDGPNKGYLNYEAHPTNSSITDYELSTSSNWTGAEVVVRKFRYILDRHIITYQAGNTLYYNQGSTTYTPTDNNGYFIQNHIATLDQLGEWYYSPSEKKLKMYFGGNNPNSYGISASALDYLAIINAQSNIVFSNLTFKGANVQGLNIVSAQNINITNCVIANSGVSAIEASHTNNMNIEYSYVSNSNNNGMDLGNDNNYLTLRYNTVENTALFAGMGQSMDGNGVGIAVGGTGNVLEYNQVNNTGYTGIVYQGNDILIKNNIVNNFCLIKDDGGGIYTLGTPGHLYSGRKIIGNIVINGIGAGAGTDDVDYLPVMGIYMDNNASGVEVRDNTVANMSFQGMIFLNAHDIVVNNNTFFNNKSQIAISDFGSDLIRNNYIANNIFFSKFPDQKVSSLASFRNDFGLWGLFQSNYYCRPLNDKVTITTNYIYNNFSSQKLDAYDIEGWAAQFLIEQNSQRSPIQYPAYYVNSSTGINKFPNGAFNSNIGYPANYSPTGNIRTAWNGGRLDGGCMQVSFPGASVNGDIAITGFPVGSATNGRKYLVKFSSVGAANNKSMSVFMRNSEGPYNAISPVQAVKISSTRAENELLFTVNASVNSADIVFQMNDQIGTFWLDNLEITEVDAVYTNPDEVIRFEYNPSASSRTVNLDGSYVDVKNKAYSNSVTLQPYSSIVLLRTSQGQVTNPPADQTPPTIIPKNITIQANGNGQAFIQPSDVIQSITDNSGVNSSTIQISQSQFNCSTVSSGNSATRQAFSTNETTGVQAYRGELGMEFHVDNPAGIFVNQLGAFDHLGDGINGTQSGGIHVAIFDKNTKTVVPGLDVIISGLAENYSGNYRMRNVPPVLLKPGIYMVVAKGYNQNELNGNGDLGSPTAILNDGNGAVSFSANGYFGQNNSGNTFTYPTNLGNAPGYLAGTFTYSTPNGSSSGTHQAFTTSTATGVQPYLGELGMIFHVNDPAGIVVNQLGAFDHQGNGIIGTQNGGVRVAIFNKTTQTIVPGLDVIIAGLGENYTGNHRMKNVPPVTLKPGMYMVVAKGYNTNELNGNATMGSPAAIQDGNNGAVTFAVNGYYGSNDGGNGFSYPANIGGVPAYLAGTFTYKSAGATNSSNNSVNNVIISAQDNFGNLGQAIATVTVLCNLGQNQRQANVSTSETAQSALVAQEILKVGDGLNIFPNPSTGKFSLQLSNVSSQQTTIEILSASGKTVTKKALGSLGAVASSKVDFDLSNQPAGVYFIKVFGSDGVKTGKVVIQR